MHRHHERRRTATPKPRVSYLTQLMGTAIALRNAKELSIDVGSHDQTDTTKQHGWPVVWDLTGQCYVYNPRDDGVPPTDAATDHNPTKLTREVGLKTIGHNFDEHHHFGSKPNIFERRAAARTTMNDVKLKRPARNNMTDTTCPVPTPAAPIATSHVRRWLVDSGSGYDLVCANNVEHVRNLIKRSAKPIALWTANGLTPAEKEIVLHLDRLDMDVCAFVLNSTPDVLSLGRHCAARF